MKFCIICNEFNKNLKFNKLKNELHHGTNRYSHVKRVARLSFLISKMFKCDSVSTTRGAFLHDFFLNNEFDNFENHLLTHPKKSLINSKQSFKLNKVEEDIIKNHMFPITKNFPKYKESYIVSICDKIISIYEFFIFQIKFSIYVLIIFMLEMFNNYI